MYDLILVWFPVLVRFLVNLSIYENLVWVYDADRQRGPLEMIDHDHYRLGPGPGAHSDHSQTDIFTIEMKIGTPLLH